MFVGIELEYPVASLEGDATNVEIIKDLFHYLVSALDFIVEKVDDFWQSYPVSRSDKSGCYFI